MGQRFTVRISTASALVALCAVITCIGLMMTAARASAVFRELAENGVPGVLVLSLDSSTPLWAELAPGESMRWLVEASLRDAERGDLSLEVQADGGLVTAAGMTAAVDACSGSFVLGTAAADATPECTGSAEHVLRETPLNSIELVGSRIPLDRLLSSEPRELLVTLSLPADADGTAVAGRRAAIGLGVHVTGDDSVAPPPAPPARLPVTGSDAAALAVLATGLFGLGAALALRRRAGSRRPTERSGGAP